MRQSQKIGWSLGDAFPAGYYWAIVPTTEYNKLGNPLDVARKSGAVVPLQAVTFGHMGESTWIQIRVPSDTDTDAAENLKSWATWWVGKASDTIQQKVSRDEMKGGLKTEVFDSADKLSKEGAEFIDESAKKLGSIGGKLLIFAVGFVTVGFLWERAKGSKK